MRSNIVCSEESATRKLLGVENMELMPDAKAAKRSMIYLEATASLKEPALTQPANTLGFRVQQPESVQSRAVNLLQNTAVLNANRDSDYFLMEAANKAQSRVAMFMPWMDSANHANDHSTPNTPVSVSLWGARK